MAEREQIARELLPLSDDSAKLLGHVAMMHTAWMQREDMMREAGGFELMERMADLMDKIVDAVPELSTLTNRVLSEHRTFADGVEAAARVADALELQYSGQSEFDDGAASACCFVASAIRSLAGPGEERG